MVWLSGRPWGVSSLQSPACHPGSRNRLIQFILSHDETGRIIARGSASLHSHVFQGKWLALVGWMAQEHHTRPDSCGIRSVRPGGQHQGLTKRKSPSRKERVTLASQGPPVPWRVHRANAPHLAVFGRLMHVVKQTVHIAPHDPLPGSGAVGEGWAVLQRYFEDGYLFSSFIAR